MYIKNHPGSMGEKIGRSRINMELAVGGSCGDQGGQVVWSRMVALRWREEEKSKQRM